MKKFQNSKNKKAILAVLGVELIILLVFLVMCFIPKKSYLLDSNNNTITLPYGHYYITCNFKIQDDLDTVNYLHIRNTDGTTKGITQTDNYYLNPEHTTYTSEFWINTMSKKIVLIVMEFQQSTESQSAVIDNYIIQSTSYTAFLGILLDVVLLLITFVFYLSAIGKIKFTKENIVNIIILFSAFIISCIPLAGNELIRGDDTMIHLIRLEGMKDGYLAGQIPVKVEPTFNGGYGYAFSTYYGSLFYNIPAFLRLMGFSILNAYKAYVIIVNAATVWLAYYSFKIIFKKEKTAVLGSVLYSLSVYRVYILYQRGAVGEYTSMVFLPLIAAGMWKIYTTPVDDKNYSRLWIIPVIGYSGVIESHVLSTELYGGFTILLCLILAKKTFRKQTFIVLLKVLLITAVLNIGYLLPFIESYICEDTIISSNMLAETRLSQGLSILDVFRFFTGGNEDGVWWRDYIIGGFGPTFLPVILLLIYTIIKRKIGKNDKNLLLILAIIMLVSVTLSLNIFPWNNLLDALYNGTTDNAILSNVLKRISLLFMNVQFRVRFMIVGIVAYTIFTCVILSQRDEKRILKFASGFIVALTVVQFIWAGAFIMIRSERTNLYAISPEDQDVTCNIGNFEYIPLKSDGGIPYIVSFTEPLSCLTTNAEVTNYKKEYTNIYIHVKAKSDNVGLVEVPLLYYIGYKAVDINTGKEFNVFKSGSNARLCFVVENGYEGDIKVYYAGKTSWHIAEIVSIVIFLSIVGYAVYPIAKKRYAKI